MTAAPFDLAALVDRTCAHGAMQQLPGGAMPPGQNGPHNHTMTGARTTSHWAILFTFAHQLTGQQRYLQCAHRAYDALLSPRFRPLGGAFWHRQHDFRSSTNGLIGQAWTLEALHHGAQHLQRDDLLAAARDLVAQHRFNTSAALWHEIDLDGTARALNTTLNQQIWFAALAHRVNGDDARADAFLHALPRYATMHRSGLFHTGIFPHQDGLRRLRHRLRQWQGHWRRRHARLDVDNGYHLFTLTGLAMLHQQRPAHPYFQSRHFRRALAHAFSPTYAAALKTSSFGYPYNVPGFEFPYVYTTFRQHLPPGALPLVHDALRCQLAAHLDPATRLLTAATPDPVTLLARTYELARIPASFWQMAPSEGMQS